MMNVRDSWNPDQYDLFKAERRQPFWDLVHMIQPQGLNRAVDLGCGTAELTAQMHRCLRLTETLGLDLSPAMLAKGQEFLTEGMSLCEGDLATWRGQDLDLIFSNAALQWTADHPTLFVRFKDSLRPGGQLAIQMPANFDHPSHRLAADVAAEPPFRDIMDNYRRTVSVLSPEAYRELLQDLGYKEATVLLKVYGHSLPSTSAVVEWVKGTLLTDYQSRLSPELYPAFLNRYKERLIAALGGERPYFYTYKRLLIWART